MRADEGRKNISTSILPISGGIPTLANTMNSYRYHNVAHDRAVWQQMDLDIILARSGTSGSYLTHINIYLVESKHQHSI